METTPASPANDLRGQFLEEKAFKSRTVFLFGAITDVTAADTARQLVALAADSSAPIRVLVSSPGGHLESGDAIYGIVRFIDVPVFMIGTGWVGSAATHVFLSVPRERRVCLPQTRFLIHQPSGGAGGVATDIAIQAREIVKARARIAAVIAKETGQPLEQVLQDIDRDNWMSPEEAIQYREPCASRRPRAPRHAPPRRDPGAALPSVRRPRRGGRRPSSSSRQATHIRQPAGHRSPRPAAAAAQPRRTRPAPAQRSTAAVLARRCSRRAPAAARKREEAEHGHVDRYA